MKKPTVALAMTFIMVMALGISNVLAKPEPKEGNPGLPGCLAKVDQLQALLDAMENYSPVPQTGQTQSYYVGDDGYLEKGMDWPQPRFTDNNDGTILDNMTGLIWLKNANCFGEKTWANALFDCNTLASGDCGLTDGSQAGDWRLPNIRELQSLIHYGVHDPALPNTSGTGKWSEGDPFVGVLCDVTNCNNGYYWSSTTSPASEDALFMYLGGGFVRGLNKSHQGYFVWPVRNPE